MVANQEVIYIGECQNLSKRFNDGGYGTIHPRNCFKGGQSTNCRINALILGVAKQGCKIDLWFHASSDRYDVERRPILQLRPRWNVQHGKRAALIGIGTETDSAKSMSKLKAPNSDFGRKKLSVCAPMLERGRRRWRNSLRD